MKMSVPPKYRHRDNYSMAEGILIVTTYPEDQVLTLIFAFCWLKLSMMTPMNRLRVKKEPKNDEDDKENVHVEVWLIVWLHFNLHREQKECLRATHVLQEDNKDVRLCQDSVRSLSQRPKSNVTSRESTALYMMSIHPLNVAWKQNENIFWTFRFFKYLALQ